MMVHINSNPLATEFNPSITQRAVANFSHRLQIVASPTPLSLSLSLASSLSVTHIHSLTADLPLAIFIWFRCIFISNSYMAAGCAVIRHPQLALVAL